MDILRPSRPWSYFSREFPGELLDAASVRLHLRNKLRAARNASPIDAWRMLRLDDWVTWAHGQIYENARAEVQARPAALPKALPKSFPKAKAKPKAKAQPKAKAKAKAKAQPKAKAKAKAKAQVKAQAKAKAKAKSVPKVMARPAGAL